MVMFIIGCFVGTFFGIAIMCLVQYNNIGEPAELKAEVIQPDQNEHITNNIPISTSSTDQNWQKLF